MNKCRTIPLLSQTVLILFALTLPGVAFGQQTAMDFNKQGFDKFRKGDLAGAIADFTKAIELDPKHASAYYNSRGNAKTYKGDFDDGIDDFTKAIELNPRFAVYYKNRGEARKTKGDQAGADEDFAQARKLGFAGGTN